MYSFFIAVKLYNQRMSVYIEYAIIDNLVINYLLIKTATRCALVKTSFLRVFLSAVIGTAVAVVLPLLNVSGIYLIIIKFALGLLMTLVGGKFISYKKYFFTALLFFIFTLLCGGFIIALFNFALIDYQDYFTSNYDSVLPIGLTVFLVYVMTKTIVYLAIKLLKEKNLRPFLRQCLLIVNSKKFSVKGFIDSGNSLYDSRSGLPIVVCSNMLFQKLKRVGVRKSVSSIEFDTVSGSSKMELYLIDKLMIYNGLKVNIFNNVLIGVAPFGFNSSSYDLLLHPLLGE